MGRITIFIKNDCSDCHRAIVALISREIPHVEINLCTHPDRLHDMLSLCDSDSVPQVFFNDDYVGGADETTAVLEGWDRNKRCYSAYDHYIEQVAKADGPWDLRLRRPKSTSSSSSSPSPPAGGGCKAKMGLVELYDGSNKLCSVVAMTTFLVKVMPRDDLLWRARIYKDCFTGRDGVKALKKYFKLPNRKDAIRMGRSLQRKQILHHVCNNRPFGYNSYFFRLQPFNKPKVLNSFRVWTDVVDLDTFGLITRLENQVRDVLFAATDAKGIIDYVAAEADPKFVIFEEAVCELQGVYLGGFKETEKLTFGIRLYNLMITHAYIRVGVPSNSVQRASFHRNVCYDIGGDVFSLDDFEHGVLRANSHPPFIVKKPFGKNDTRASLSLEKLDPRLHFAISYGKNRLPPIDVLSPRTIEEDLQYIAEEFFADDDNVNICFENNELSLPMLFYWFRSDFAKSESELPQVILPYLRGAKFNTLDNMISRGFINVKFVANDKRWNRRSRAKPFDKSRLESQALSVKAALMDSSSTSSCCPTKDRQTSLCLEPLTDIENGHHGIKIKEKEDRKNRIFRAPALKRVR